MSSDRPNQRNEVDSTAAKNEVQALMKDGVTELSPDIISRLRSKYPDENVIDSITEFFTERKKKINKVANIFMDAFQRKYTNDFNGMSMSKFMKKALKYKTTYNLSNDEFDEIKRVFERRLYNSPNGSTVVDKWLPDTNISRVLGHPVVETMDGIKPANTDDYSYLQEIIKLYQLFRSLHSYVVLQSMSYNNYLNNNPETMNGTYDIKRHNKYVHVHPVIAALFLPKIDELEYRMIYASIANIVNIRYNRQQILTKPDFDLFYAMVVDPADAVCDNISPLRDLKNRTEVQIQLWNNVFNLRSGRAYEATSIEFMSTLDKCKVSNMDHPDLVYLSDEGVILRRLFSVFSFRPIIMQSSSIMNVISTNPLAIPPNIVSITAVPYIVLRLSLIPSGTARIHGVPGNLSTLDPNDQPDLEKALGQIQFTMENGIFVPKMMNLFLVNGPLIFYVPRKYNTLPLSINTSISYKMPSQYKNSMISYQNYIDTVVNVEQTIKLPEYSARRTTGVDTDFKLKSIVMYELNSNIIIGHKTLIYIDDDIQEYNPLSVKSSLSPKASHKYINVFGDRHNNANQEGTIFVYTKDNENDTSNNAQHSASPVGSRVDDNLLKDIVRLMTEKGKGKGNAKYVIDNEVALIKTAFNALLNKDSEQFPELVAQIITAVLPETPETSETPDSSKKLIIRGFDLLQAIIKLSEQLSEEISQKLEVPHKPKFNKFKSKMKIMLIREYGKISKIMKDIGTKFKGDRDFTQTFKRIERLLQNLQEHIGSFESGAGENQSEIAEDQSENGEDQSENGEDLHRRGYFRDRSGLGTGGLSLKTETGTGGPGPVLDNIKTEIQQLKTNLPNYSTDSYKQYIRILQQLAGYLEEDKTNVITKEHAKHLLSEIEKLDNTELFINAAFVNYLSILKV